MKLRSIIAACALALLGTACSGAVAADAPPAESIAVHGDWVIEVHNPDGSLDERVEFSNDLGSGGPDLLASLLSGQLSMGSWEIHVAGFSGPNLCEPVQVCRIAESDGWNAGNAQSTDLEVSREEDVVVLAGSVEAVETTAVNNVSTWAITCAPQIAPRDCVEGSAGPIGSFTGRFTVTSVAPVDVTAGQTIAVRVEISFTTG